MQFCVVRLVWLALILIFPFQTDVHFVWDARVSCSRDHSRAWSWKRSRLVGVRYPNLRDVSGVSCCGGDDVYSVCVWWRKREREWAREREREREEILQTGIWSLSSNRYPPFFDEHPFRIYEKILEGKVEWPRHLEPNAKDLVKKLLVRDVTRRLGSLKVRK